MSAGNRGAGLAVENGFGFIVRENAISANQHGILMWSRHVPRFVSTLPENDTCYDWLIEANEFSGNVKAIRVAANQDHGVRPLNGSTSAAPTPRTYTIRNNHLQHNRVNFDMANAKTAERENNLA